MNRFRARSCPFEDQLRFSSREIESMCIEALRAAELLPSSPEPIRIERFIEKHFSCPVNYEDLGEGVMGCTVFRDTGAIEVVIISNRLDDGREVSDRRARSTLAHEAGHCLMHASLFIRTWEQRHLGINGENRDNLDFERRRILCRDGDVGPVGQKRAYNGRWWEWQANRAIGEFLLPANLVREASVPFVELTPVTNSAYLPATRRVEAERELAKIFHVNPIVARIRLQELFPMNVDQTEF
jgi:hypothetical protein